MPTHIIRFPLGKDAPPDKVDMDALYRALSLEPIMLDALRVDVVGHTCVKPVFHEATVAAFGTNEKLSLCRAAQVAGALADYGVSPSNLKVTGVGSTKPTGNADIAQDRRVEVTW